MVQNNYMGYDKVMKDALVENRGKTLVDAKADKILELEKRLEREKLSNTEIAEIQKQLKKLRSSPA
jgi:hypothetical protein